MYDIIKNCERMIEPKRDLSYWYSCGYTIYLHLIFIDCEDAWYCLERLYREPKRRKEV